MPYGIDTGGGAWGGAARGLQIGLGMGEHMYEAAADEKYRQQEMGLRLKDYGLREREQDRLDRNDQRQLHIQAAGEIGKQQEQLSDGIAGYVDLYNKAKRNGATPDQLAALNNDPGLADLTKHYDALAGLRQDHLTRAFGQDVVDEYRNTMQVADKLRNGQISIDDLTHKDAYRLAAMTRQDPEHFLPGDDGKSKIRGHVEDVHSAAQNGNWPAAADHAGHVLAPYASPHPPDHDSHFPGLRVPDAADPNVEHDHIGASMDTLGRIGAFDAAVGASPAFQKKIAEGAADGGREERNLALMFLYQHGSIRGLTQKLAEPHPLEEEFQGLQDQIRQAHPDWTAAKVSAESLARIKPNEQALKDAQAAEARARTHLLDVTSDYTASGKGKLYRGSDSGTYHEAPSGALVDADGNPLPEGVTATPLSGGGSGSRSAIGHRKVQDGAHVEERPYQIITDPQTGQPTGYRDLQQVDATPPGAPAANIVAGPNDPAGVTRRDRSGRLAKSLGGGQWQIQ